MVKIIKAFVNQGSIILGIPNLYPYKLTDTNCNTENLFKDYFFEILSASELLMRGIIDIIDIIKVLRCLKVHT